VAEEKTYDEAAIAAKLIYLPLWTYANGALERTYKTANFKGALMVTMAIGHLAEVAWHHPDLAVSYDQVTVRLSTHSAKGITDKDFALAQEIERVIAWQPSGGLTGTPKDPKYAYVIAG
jgi:4a-hydroxytetrahydrobiopterin dehydratase